jgi:hypothetical protein
MRAHATAKGQTKAVRPDRFFWVRMGVILAVGFAVCWPVWREVRKWNGWVAVMDGSAPEDPAGKQVIKDATVIIVR